MKITVSMTETTTTVVAFEIDSLGEMVGLTGDPGESDSAYAARLRDFIAEHGSPTYGVDTGEALLDAVLDPGRPKVSFIVSDRDWSFEWPAEAEAVQQVAGIRAPQHAPDWDD